MNESRPPRRLTARVLLALAALAVAAVLAACGGDDSSSGTTAASGGSGSAEVPQELTVGSAQKILTLDPDLAADGYSEGVVHLLGGNLYELGADRQVRPQLADGDGVVSDDGLTWTFELREGLRFSDGTPLTSEDVKATIERAKSDRSNVYIGFVDPIERVEAPTPTKVVMHLNRPYPSLQMVLSEPETTIFPKEGLAQGKSFFNAPVSAGQFMLESWGGSPRAVLVRNPNYAGDP
ncbi:MAG TPA: ABC transporter substrate-binding protein, partial [Conexibacter sp.]|nr:ABC transporter substrate-binding protein [Conexibacter sp.]